MKKHILAIALVLMGVMLQAQTPVKLSDLQKKDKIYYQNDQLFNGQCYEKHENGKIGLKGTINNGMKDGVWTWWYSTGEKRRETIYVDNKKHGITYFWYQNGQKAKELTFKMDKNIDQKLWDENGMRLPNPTFSPIPE